MLSYFAENCLRHSSDQDLRQPLVSYRRGNHIDFEFYVGAILEVTGILM